MPNEAQVTINLEQVDSVKAKLRAMIVMTEALGRIAEEDFNHPNHVRNIARKALREAREIIKADR